jgi:HEAT repeat protein
MTRRLQRLQRRLDGCLFSDDYVRVIRAITETQEPRAIPILASLLDSQGPIAEAAVQGLLTFGESVAPAMRRRLDHEDSDVRRHARLVLARLGDEVACRELADGFLEYERGPLGTARWLVGCGRRGIEALARSSDPLMGAAVPELVRQRTVTEDILLELAQAADAGGIPYDALDALAQMPSERAAPTFARLLRDPRCDVYRRALALEALTRLDPRQVHMLPAPARAA